MLHCGTPLKSSFVGQCIYCGHREGLTDEHAPPFSLTGNAHVLHEAVCAKCKRDTHGHEERFVSKCLGPLRHGRLMPSRGNTRRKSGLPRGALVTLMRTDKSTSRQYVESKDLPKFTFMLPRYELPPFLMVRPSPEERRWKGARWMQTCIDLGDLEHQAKEFGAIIVPECDEADACRTLAKMAYGVAVGWLGVDGWTPYLRDYIRGKPPPGPIRNYIGSQFAFTLDKANLQPEQENQVVITVSLFPLPNANHRCVFANIHILPNIGQARPPNERVPYFGVLVGKCSEEKYQETQNGQGGREV